MKPLLIFDGNCQSHHLAAIFDSSGLAEAYVNGRDFGLIPSFRGKLCRYADEERCLLLVKAAKEAGRLTIQSSQATPMAPLLAASYSGHVEQLARFPYLQFTPMLQATNATVRPGAYARSYEIDRQIIAMCQSEAGSNIDFVSFIENEQSARPLFHMHVHPGPELMAMLVRALGAQLTVDQKEVAAVAAEVSRGEAINMFTQHPLPPDLLSSLGFHWPDWYQSYSDLIIAGREQDHDVLRERRAEFEALFGNDSQFWNAYFNMALAQGASERVVEAFNRLSQLSTGYIGIWYAMYVHGGRDPAVLQRAAITFAGQRQLDQFLSRIASEEGRHEEAIYLADRYRQAAADLTDGVVPLVLAYQLADRSHDAHRVASEFARATEDHRRDEVFASLQRLPNPVYLDRPAIGA